MILAIDPGINGALALYDPDVEWLYTERLPTRWRMVNKKKKFELDLATLRAFIANRPLIDDVIVEQSTAMPGAGATSQFNYGRTIGQCEALIVGMDLPLTCVSPVKWKTALDVPSDKNRSRERARKMFPHFAHRFQATASEGEGEAAMLAYYRFLVKTRAAMPELARANVKAVIAKVTQPATAKRGPGRPPKKKAA